jgi:hypothetical protein
MKIFWVLGWDQYYPCDDNFLASFDNEGDAQEYISLQDKYFDHYEIVNISDRL